MTRTARERRRWLICRGKPSTLWDTLRNNAGTTGAGLVRKRTLKHNKLGYHEKAEVPKIIVHPMRGRRATFKASLLRTMGTLAQLSRGSCAPLTRSATIALWSKSTSWGTILNTHTHLSSTEPTQHYCSFFFIFAQRHATLTTSTRSTKISQTFQKKKKFGTESSLSASRSSNVGTQNRTTPWS